MSIPPGVKHGQKLALRGQGGRGRQGGEPGDAFIIVDVVYPNPAKLSDEEKKFLQDLDAKATS